MFNILYAKYIFNAGIQKQKQEQQIENPEFLRHYQSWRGKLLRKAGAKKRTPSCWQQNAHTHSLLSFKKRIIRKQTLLTQFHNPRFGAIDGWLTAPHPLANIFVQTN